MNTRRLRRVFRVFGGSMVALSACVALALGVGRVELFDGFAASSWSALIVAAMLLILVASVTRRVRFVSPSQRRQRVSRLMSIATSLADIDIALAMVAGTYAVIAATGAAQSHFYPLLYALIAFSATFQRWSASWVALVAAILLELSTLRFGAPAEWVGFHIVFVAGAFGLHALFLRSTIAMLRREHKLSLKHSILEERQSAREFRLIASSLGSHGKPSRGREDEEAMLEISAVSALSDSIQSTLELLRETFNAKTVATLWLNERGDRFKIKELLSDSEYISDARELPLAGVLGALARDKAPLLLPTTRARQIPYYIDTTKSNMGAFMGAPIMEGGNLRGVVVVDRPAPFAESELDVLKIAANHLFHLVRSEQIFGSVERSKYEHERFFFASSLLCKALTVEEVMNTAFDAAEAIVDYDLAVIALYNKTTRKHRIHSFRVPPNRAPMATSDELVGVEYRDNAGLAAMVVKNRHYLPAGGELRDVSVPVFTKKIRFRGAESLVVLPLLSADEAIGTLTLVSRKSKQFRKDARAMLGIIAAQVAVSLQNALMYRQMETMATTDGLTGLTNHRTFQERFADLIERSARHERKAAMLLCDVDHFKKVNDTYGHPVGDEVLRQVARVLSNAVRKIDIPARYGGEEFAVVLEATDLDGAMQLAERIRKEVSELVIESEKGPFQVAMSIGVSVYPDDAEVKQELIEKADLALYEAKETGRNQVVNYQAFQQARGKRAS